jgi:tetratricopeptide (TPR) repeat protein|tara:strand:+ start:308 stop:862 length:555 start_codon:yes stop_codon:yes gene_type:complete
MKRIKFLIIIILNIVFFSNTFADERNQQLDGLFKELKTGEMLSNLTIEQKIWKIWSTHPKDENLTKLLQNGSDLVSKKKFFESIDIFTKVINFDPSWAEAWNKRATVFYLIGEFQKSQNDIDKVLELENRHFGALAGQGLVNIKLKNYEKAIESYKRALEIYPTMQSPEIMIKQIEEIIKEELI